MARFLLALSLLFFAAPLFAAEPDKPQIMISLRCCEGDPKGTREDGTLKVLSEPKLVALSGQSATIIIGGEKALGDGEAEITFGLKCIIKPTLRKDGKVLLEVDFSATELVESDSPDQVAAVGRTIKSATVVKPGEMKVIGRRGSGKEKEWLEATVEVTTEKGEPRPLPGFDVQEPKDKEFFQPYNGSGVRQRYKQGSQAKIRGPFGLGE